ncbi:sigma 54-interacting transcriptional regulator [Fodinisporobacter ferrooxydans]|uniref:Sigma 54-interacting transcriptional regulator n=1 Tax=Fodinisporobacter ferrooxydans TaxID=2901836 RepID=A0ABY4CKV6_9BACL|nr:sigma 54-interacting transcriptional regulator [Alicyclobacillaceae bacterium MYW30-H2]
MNYKIIMTSPYPEMTASIRKLAEELEYPITIIEDTMMSAAKKVAEFVANGGYEVVISRAGTAQAIATMVDLPIVYCDNNDFDVMQAFLRAKKLGERIGFLTYPEDAFPYRMDLMLDSVGFEVVQLPYRNWEDLMKQIQVAADLGLDVVVGGGVGAQTLVRQYGMKGMHIATSERTIKRSFIRAAEIARYRIAAREKAERLNAVIHVSEEAILLVGEHGQIETFNPAAEKLFGISASLVIGSKFQEVAHPKLQYLLNREELNTGSNTITTEDLIVTYEPVQVESKKVGTVITCREISKIQHLENQIRRELHAKGLLARFHFRDIRYVSEKMNDMIQRASFFAQTDSTILINGESGTGKELIAQGIHNSSKRKEGAFVAINCAALPESLLESELFGYSEGAFTGAKKGGRMGLFEMANGGTIFLDEIGEISPMIQARLLRVVQEKEVMRVGGDRVIPVDIRIVAATNRNLWHLVKKGEFRSDLFFRLSVLRLELPPLRERREDIPVIVDSFLEKKGVPYSWATLSEKMKHFFLSYFWPGNIRELENIVERYRLSIQSFTEESHFIREVLNETEFVEPPADSESVFEDQLMIKIGTMEDMEKQIIMQMLNRYEQNRRQVAESLGISRTTLWKKLSTTEEFQ